MSTNEIFIEAIRVDGNEQANEMCRIVCATMEKSGEKNTGKSNQRFQLQHKNGIQLDFEKWNFVDG